MMVNKYMEANQGGVWWDFKRKARCLTCKATADDTTLEETRMNHIARTSRKDVARANACKKTTETNKLDWQLAQQTAITSAGQDNPAAKRKDGGIGITCWLPSWGFTTSSRRSRT